MKIFSFKQCVYIYKNNMIKLKDSTKKNIFNMNDKLNVIYPEYMKSSYK